MEPVIATVRKWGNSKGVVLPAGLGLKEGEEVELTIKPKSKYLTAGDIFGKLKTGLDTAKSLKQIDKELDIKWE